VRSITYIAEPKSFGGHNGSMNMLNGLTRLTNGKSFASESDVTYGASDSFPAVLNPIFINHLKQ